MASQTDPIERIERIVAVIRSLREGEVVTYGEIADDAGFAKQSRLVGRILATTADDLPWWRVVNAAGRLVPGHEREQRELLLAEGVGCSAGHVRFARYGRFKQTAAQPTATQPVATRPREGLPAEASPAAQRTSPPSMAQRTSRALPERRRAVR